MPEPGVLFWQSFRPVADAAPDVGAPVGVGDQRGMGFLGLLLAGGVVVLAGRVIVPFGNDHIEAGDNVVIIACESGIGDLNEVIRK